MRRRRIYRDLGRPSHRRVGLRLDTEEAVARFTHADIAGLTDAEIWSERIHLTLQLAERQYTRRDRWVIFAGEHIRASDWIRQRIQLLGREARRRRSGGRRVA